MLLPPLGSEDALPRRADAGADPDQPAADQLPDGGAGADAADLPGEPPQLGRHPQLRLALHHAQPQGRRHARHGGVVQELAGEFEALDGIMNNMTSFLVLVCLFASLQVLKISCTTTATTLNLQTLAIQA